MDLNDRTYRPGAKVSLTLQNDSVVSGFIHTVDPGMGLVMLRVPLVHTTLSSELKCISVRGVKSASVDVEGSEAPKAPRAVAKKVLAMREEKALRQLEGLMAELNDSATPEGQAVFDALHKTLDCKWVDGTSINVLDQVRIEPPYQTSDCASLDGDEVAYQRILKILVAAKASAAGAGTQDGGAAAGPPGV